MVTTHAMPGRLMSRGAVATVFAACVLLLAASCEPNHPPQTPVVTADFRVGSLEATYRFHVTAGDSDGDEVGYQFDWGDGSHSDWSALAPCDSAVTMTHAWDDTGRFAVRAQAQDEHGRMAGWSEPETITITDNAPDFTLPDLAGFMVTLHSLLEAGPVYVVWWDLPCVNSIMEVDDLQQVYDSLSPRGFTLLAISVDKSSDEARVRSFVAAKGWRCPVLLDSARLSKDLYDIIIKPTGVLVSMDTAVVYTHIGYKKGDWQTIRSEVLKWLPPRTAEGIRHEDAR